MTLLVSDNRRRSTCDGAGSGPGVAESGHGPQCLDGLFESGSARAGSRSESAPCRRRFERHREGGTALRPARTLGGAAREASGRKADRARANRAVSPASACGRRDEWIVGLVRGPDETGRSRLQSIVGRSPGSQVRLSRHRCRRRTMCRWTYPPSCEQKREASCSHHGAKRDHSREAGLDPVVRGHGPRMKAAVCDNRRVARASGHSRPDPCPRVSTDDAPAGEVRPIRHREEVRRTTSGPASI